MRHRFKIVRRARPMADFEPPWCRMAPLARARSFMAAAFAGTRSPTAARAVSIACAESAVPCHAAR